MKLERSHLRAPRGLVAWRLPKSGPRQTLSENRHRYHFRASARQTTNQTSAFSPFHLAQTYAERRPVKQMNTTERKAKQDAGNMFSHIENPESQFSICSIAVQSHIQSKDFTHMRNVTIWRKCNHDNHKHIFGP